MLTKHIQPSQNVQSLRVSNQRKSLCKFKDWTCSTSLKQDDTRYRYTVNGVQYTQYINC